MIVIIILCQTLTDPTVKHECSPDVTEDPDYWVTYRFACFFSINIVTIITIMSRNKVAALADQFKEGKPNNGL